MHIQVIRKELTPRSTIGELHVDGEFECFTLEDAVRPVKIPGLTAIPAGIYETAITHSARFNRRLPLLMNVPNFEGVRIHTGNTDANTEGCLLVGKTKAKDFIGNSRAAFAALFGQMEQAARREKIFVEIVQDAQAPRGALAPRAAVSLQRSLGASGKAAGRGRAAAPKSRRAAGRRGKQRAVRRR
jgi:hypothetical protein